MYRWEGWPTPFDFSLADYALIAAMGLVSFGVAVAGVGRQRRGDAKVATPWTAGSGGFPERLVSLFRFPCPTSSPTRAQVWFDLKSSGLPVLAIGVAFAIVNPLLFAVSGPIDAAFSGLDRFDDLRDFLIRGMAADGSSMRSSRPLLCSPY